MLHSFVAVSLLFFGPSSQDDKPQVVILIRGSDVSSKSWDPLIKTLQAHQGRKTRIVRFPCKLKGGVPEAARSLKRKIDGLLPARIHIVAHGTGALVARYCLEKLYDRSGVRSLFMIAPPSKGSTVAIDQLQPGSKFLRVLNASPWKPARAVNYKIWAGTRSAPNSKGKGREILVGAGDGVVSVENAYLEGVDFATVHFNHFEIHQKSRLVLEEIRRAMGLKCKPNPGSTSLPVPPRGRRPQRVTSIALNAAGTRLAAGTASGEIMIYDLLLGKINQRLTVPSRNELDIGEGAIRSVAFLSDGKSLISTRGDGPHGFLIWNLSNGKIEQEIKFGKNFVTKFVMGSDGGVLLADRGFRGVMLWDVAKRKVGEILKPHKDLTRSLALSPDGSFAASGGADGKIHLSEVETGNFLRPFSGPPGFAWALAFSPNSDWIASASGDYEFRNACEITIREVATGQIVRILPSGRGPATSVAFGPNGKMLIAAVEEGVRIWDTSTWKVTKTLAKNRQSHMLLAQSADGKWLVSDDRDGVAVWNLPKSLAWKGCSQLRHSEEIRKERAFPRWWDERNPGLGIDHSEEWQLKLRKRLPQARQFIFRATARDPDGDKICFVFDWDDQTAQTRSPWVSSGKEVEVKHAWVNPGTYRIRCYAVDTLGNRSEWSPFTKIVIKGDNHAPTSPKIVLPQEKIRRSKSVNIRVRSRDPDGHSLQYEFDFGDGNSTTVHGISGMEVGKKHTWHDPGHYRLRVRTWDSWLSRSDWSTVQVIVLGKEGKFLRPDKIDAPAWGAVGKELVVRAQVPKGGPACRLLFQFGAPPDNKVTWKSPSRPPGTWVTARYTCPKLPTNAERKLKIRVRSIGERRTPKSRWRIIYVPITDGNSPPDVPAKPLGPREGDWRVW